MKVKFVAEVSSNHNKNLARCLEFINTAAKIGCYGVKFQLFKIDELFAPEILNKSKKHKIRKEWELPLEFIPTLSKKCRDLGLQFGCTPFYLDAVKELRPYVDFYKIASYELLWLDLIRSCGKTGLPVVLSTGMATVEEIDTAMDVIRSSEATDITLLHCISSYPVPIDQCNLAAIKTLRDRYGCKVGWSDHSVCDAVIYRAVYKWNATMIEFHMDLDGKGEEFKIGHCWLPDKIGSVIKKIKGGILADGSGEKVPVQSEMNEREWRADPSDGLRPLLKTRKSWKKK